MNKDPQIFEYAKPPFIMTKKKELCIIVVACLAAGGIWTYSTDLPFWIELLVGAIGGAIIGWFGPGVIGWVYLRYLHLRGWEITKGKDGFNYLHKKGWFPKK